MSHAINLVTYAPQQDVQNHEVVCDFNRQQFYIGIDHWCFVNSCIGNESAQQQMQQYEYMKQQYNARSDRIHRNGSVVTHERFLNTNILLPSNTYRDTRKKPQRKRLTLVGYAALCVRICLVNVRIRLLVLWRAALHGFNCALPRLVAERMRDRKTERAVAMVVVRVVAFCTDLLENNDGFAAMLARVWNRLWHILHGNGILPEVSSIPRDGYYYALTWLLLRTVRGEHGVKVVADCIQEQWRLYMTDFAAWSRSILKRCTHLCAEAGCDAYLSHREGLHAGHSGLHFLRTLAHAVHRAEIEDLACRFSVICSRIVRSGGKTYLRDHEIIDIGDTLTGRLCLARHWCKVRKCYLPKYIRAYNAMDAARCFYALSLSMGCQICVYTPRLHQWYISKQSKQRSDELVATTRFFFGSECRSDGYSDAEVEPLRQGG